MSSFKLFKIADLVSRLERVASASRFDQVSRNIHALYEKRMQVNSEALVSSAELKEVYSNFCGMDKTSNFKDHFEDVFAEPEVAKAAPDESVFGRDNYTQERNSLPSMSAASDISNSIREASLERIKDVTSGVLTVPEYHFAGYTKVAKLGDSGLAMWNVKFPTAKGPAAISVPVPVVDGFAHAPQSFFTSAGTSLPFKSASLVDFSNTYTGPERNVAAQKSGMTMGSRTLIPTAQIQTQEEATENSSISMNFSIPVDEDSDNNMSNIQNKIQFAIDSAKQALESAISSGAENPSANVSLTINYSGAMAVSDDETSGEDPEGEPQSGEFEYFPQDDQSVGEASFDEDGALVIMQGPPVETPAPFEGVIAFNVSKNTRNGVRVATVPVEVKNNKFKVVAFYDTLGNARVLTAQAITEYFAEETEVVTDDSEQEAFSNAFLSSDASLNELRKEIKAGIDGGNLSRANACLSLVATKFASAAPSVTKEYFQWIDDVKNKRVTKIAWVAEDNQLSNEDIFITR